MYLGVPNFLHILRKTTIKNRFSEYNLKICVLNWKESADRFKIFSKESF